MKKGTKKQHYIAQLVLKQFTRDGHLLVYDKASGKVFPSSTVDAAHQNDFLSFPDLDEGIRGSFFETHFQHFEGPAGAAIEDVLSRSQHGMTCVVTDESREALSYFLALQHVRTAEARERFRQLFSSMEQVFRELRNEGTEELKKWIDEGLSHRRDAKTAHAEQILNPELIHTLTTTLRSHVWLIYAAPESVPLYLGDHPVALYSHTRGDVPRGYGPRTYGTEIQFPLSRRYLLSMVERRWLQTNLPALVVRDGSMGGSLDAANVAFQRSLQVTAARQFLYCSEDAFDVAREMCATDTELGNPSRRRHETMYRGRPLR